MKTKQDYHRQINQIEQRHWDELNIVLEVNPAHLTIEYLKELKAKWEVQYAMVERMFRQLLRLVAISPIWFAIGLASVMLTEGFFLSYIIFLFPISVFIFVAGMLYISIRFGGKTRQKEIGRIINEELRRRADEERKYWFL